MMEHSESFAKKNWMRPIFTQFLVKDKSNLSFAAVINSEGEMKVVFAATANIFGKDKNVTKVNKFTSSAFDWHFNKFVGYIVGLKKKLVSVTGLPKDILAKYAPRFKYIEDNEYFVEDEEFFDKIEKEIRTGPKKLIDKGKLRKLFRKQPQRKNLFYEFKGSIDSQAVASQQDLEAIFQVFGKKSKWKEV